MVIDEKMNRFEDELYLGIYMFLWVICIDVSLFVVRFLKTDQKYLEFHLTMNFIIIVGSILNNVTLITRKQENIHNGFVFREVVFFLLEMS